MATAMDPSATGGESNGAYDDLLDTDEALTADFRCTIGMLQDDGDITEHFKATIGMASPETIAQVEEIEFQLHEETEDTLRDFKFDKYAQNNFQSGQNCKWTKEPLLEPLLVKSSQVDATASLSVWLAIQRFMGDIPNPGLNDTRDKTPIMSKIYRRIEEKVRGKATDDGRKDIKRNAADGKRQSWHKSLKQKGMGLFKRSGSTSSGDGGSVDQMDAHDAASLLEDVPVVELDLIHYIVGHGILRRDLRDEIFCQLCKQVTANPSSASTERGWMLAAMCSGCFLPSDEFGKYLRSSYKTAPKAYAEYAVYARRLLRRTAANGPRYHPPNWLEYQATKMRKYVMLPVALMDGRVQTVEADAAITASEMCQTIADKIGLTDTFGFAAFICIFDKVSSLGSGLDHVMDAISECEQVVRGKGELEEDAPWRLFFRKEMFVPWHDPSADEVATELIYKQLCRGVRTEEYRIHSEEGLARMVAKRWFVEEGKELVPGKLQQELHKYLPRSTIEGSKSRDGWTQAVISSFDEQGFVKNKMKPQEIKWQTVATAPKKWPLQFAGLFEAHQVSGPRLPRNDLVLAVSSKGFYFMDDPFHVLLAFHYYQLVEAFATKACRTKGGHHFTIITIKGDEFTFVSPNGETIAKLVSTFLDGLRRRSSWAIGLQEFVLEDNLQANTFGFSQGDVLELSQDTARREGWLTGTCPRTGQRGEFPIDSVYILPTLEKPPHEFLTMFSAMSASSSLTLPKKRGAVVLTDKALTTQAEVKRTDVESAA